MSRLFEHTDIESLTLKVRDSESRRLIDEAISAYHGGAFRSAIVSTWIAVVYDFISKTRELADQGEARPKAFIEKLTKSIDAKNIKQLQIIESELLTKHNEDFEILEQHELDDLKRLQTDRHLCAHPAFVTDSQLFQPYPEQVRTHIVHALNHLLIHAPLKGKSAIARFEADILSTSFPVTETAIEVHLQTKYLERSKATLVVHLIKGVLSAPFGQERSMYLEKIRVLAMVLRKISDLKPGIYESTMPSFVSTKFDTVPDDVLLSICPYLAKDARIWDWLNHADQERIKRLLETSDGEELKLNAATDGFAIKPLAKILKAKVVELDRGETISVISGDPRAELIERALEVYSGAGSFRSAEELGDFVIVPVAPYFEPAHVEKLLKEVEVNSQIWCAYRTPIVLEQVFNKTIHILPKTRKYWQAFVDKQIKRYAGDETEYYAYPEIQKLLKTNGK